MALGNIEIKLRPLKLAFLVQPADRKALLEAIQVNSFLWGGMYNPIIPAYQRIPTNLRHEPDTRFSSGEVIQGYLDAYDPDIVVPVGRCERLKFDIGGRKSVPLSEILSGVLDYRIPQYGVGLLEILRHFIHSELRFVRRSPLDIHFINLDDKFHIFLASVLGVLPVDVRRTIRQDYGQALDAKVSAASILNYCHMLVPGRLFLRRLTCFGLKQLPTSRPWRRDYIFFLDASKWLDIIDYWNLRALGLNVMPVAKQAVQYKATQESAQEFIESNHYPYRFNPDMYNKTTLLKSRHTSVRELRSFAEKLEHPYMEKEGRSRIVLQYWFPRIWNEWARDKDGVMCCEINAGIQRHELQELQGRIAFQTVTPELISHSGSNRRICFANEIQLHTYGASDLYAEVIPESDRSLMNAIHAVAVGSDWRFSRKGIVYLSHRAEEPVRLSLPKAKDIFSGWLRSQNWEVELSSSGHVAYQMLKKLGGVYGISTLASPRLVKLLETMSGGKTKVFNCMWQEIKNIADKERYFKNPDAILSHLTRTEILRLGLEIQCPICSQRSWYSLSEVDYELRCPKCRDLFLISTLSKKELMWSYRTFGPFSLPSQAYGSYSVLLTLRFFSELLDDSTTPMMSFALKRDNTEVEVDLGLLYRESRFGNLDVEVIFAECKTYNRFEKRDVERMRLLGNEFPGAVLVFSTLGESLSEREKGLLRPLVKRGRKSWKHGRQLNPVLVLTGTELFSDSRPPYCWQDGDLQHQKLLKAHPMSHDFIELCDLTQVVYLDMKSRGEWLAEHNAKDQQDRAVCSMPEVAIKKAAKNVLPSSKLILPIILQQVETTL